jgi:VanZ family protein
MATVLEKGRISGLFLKVIKFWLPVILWLMVIFLFSSRPTLKTSEIYWQDFIFKKSAHMIEYAILATLFYRALTASGVNKKEAGIYSIILAATYGLSDEFHQYFTPGREPRIRDVIFDTIGAFLAIWTIWKYLPKAPKKLKILAQKLQIN